MENDQGVLVEVCLPTVSRRECIYISNDLTIQECIKLLNEWIKEDIDEDLKISYIYHKQLKSFLSNNLQVKEIKILDGDRLILI